MNRRDKLKNYKQANLMLEQSYLKSKGLLNEELLNEVEDLELKKTAKELFSVAKKYNLKPDYKTTKVNFHSGQSQVNGGYGAIIVVDNGMLTIGIYDRGVLQSIRRGGFPGVEAKEVSDSSDDPYNDTNKKGLSKALGILFKEFMAKLPQDKFESRNTGNKPNENGFYLIQAKPKQ
jgi:hypothetical protein